MAKIIILGPAHPLRGGGMTTFNHRLAKEFIAMGHTCSIYSFSLQYPDFLFPGKSQYTDEPPPQDITIHSVVNSINPLNWLSVGKRLKQERPDIIVVRYWLPLMGPALGTILRMAKKNGHSRIICIADNIIPHEKRPGDKAFTRYFLKACDGFITMSDKVMKDLRSFTHTQPAVMVQHPLYDNFGPIVSKAIARQHLNISQTGKIMLFFGFIRKYKGLDILLQAFQQLQSQIPDLKLMIAGEFYEEPKMYQELIDQLGIREQLILKTDFIADSEVKYYLCAADVLVQPYKNATQSGVTPLAYHFEKPMIVTNVGGLPALVPHKKSGLVCEPNPSSLTQAVKEFYELGEDHFIPHLRSEKEKYSWKNIVEAIIALE